MPFQTFGQSSMSWDDLKEKPSVFPSDWSSIQGEPFDNMELENTLQDVLVQAVQWENQQGVPNFLDKDLSNQPGEAVVLDAMGKIPSNLIPDNPFSLATNLIEIAVFQNFSEIILEAVDPFNGVEWWFFKTGEWELGNDSLIKKTGNAVTFDGTAENPTGQPVVVYLNLVGTGNKNTLEKLVVSGQTYQRIIAYKNVYFPSLLDFEIWDADNTDYSLLSSVKFFEHNQVKEVDLDLSPLVNLETFKTMQNSASSITFGNHPELWRISISNCPVLHFNWGNIPKIEYINLNHNFLTESQLEQIIQGIYDLEQVRSPIPNCYFSAQAGGNATPNTNTLTMMDWLRVNRGWTILHN